MSKALSSRAQKVAWLVANPTEWADFPSPSAERKMIDGMKAAGLLSVKTNSKHVLDLGPLVADAKGIMRKRRHNRQDLWPR